MTKTVNRRVAIKAAIAYSAAFGGAKAFAFNLFGRNGEQLPTPCQRRTRMDNYPPDDAAKSSNAPILAPSGPSRSVRPGCCLSRNSAAYTTG